MNQKTAKKLRQLAREIFDLSQVENKQVYELVEDRNKAKIRYNIKKDENGVNIVNEAGDLSVEPQLIARGQMTNSPASLRGLYRNIKKDFKDSTRNFNNTKLASLKVSNPQF